MMKPVRVLEPPWPVALANLANAKVEDLDALAAVDLRVGDAEEVAGCCGAQTRSS